MQTDQFSQESLVLISPLKLPMKQKIQHMQWKATASTCKFRKGNHQIISDLNDIIWIKNRCPNYQEVYRPVTQIETQNTKTTKTTKSTDLRDSCLLVRKKKITQNVLDYTAQTNYNLFDQHPFHRIANELIVPSPIHLKKSHSAILKTHTPCLPLLDPCWASAFGTFCLPKIIESRLWRS